MFALHCWLELYRYHTLPHAVPKSYVPGSMGGDWNAGAALWKQRLSLHLVMLEDLKVQQPKAQNPKPPVIQIRERDHLVTCRLLVEAVVLPGKLESILRYDHKRIRIDVSGRPDRNASYRLGV